MWQVSDDKGQYLILLVPWTSEVYDAQEQAL